MWSSCVAVLLCGSVVSAAITDQQFNQLKQSVTTLTTRVQELTKTLDAGKKTISELTKDIESGRNVIGALARQVSQQQLHVEETARSHGDSGLKITRLTRTGSKTYFSTTFSDRRVASIHEHSNYRGTVGMGELVAVLNGVEFRTRHNDYKMRMPSRNSTTYGATEDIPYPQVPPQVLAKPTLGTQITEMREWFKAWKNSDYSRRDYRKYFQANLCYLEGQWTNANDKSIDEPFASDRHAIDAKSFFDLQTKIRYTSVTGRKSTKENYAYLPTTISDVDEHGNIVYAQWNYRILCHPLKRHVPLTRFRLEEDLAPRVANGKTVEAQFKERAARFSLYEDVTDTVTPRSRETYVKDKEGTFLDKLMAEIPGRDNYKANLIDNAFGEIAYNIDANITAKPKPLNVGFYHNAYKVPGADAMGVSISRRGFSDANLYVSYNSQPKVSLTKVVGRCKRLTKCTAYLSKTKGCKMWECPEYQHRVSYAIPLEIIYTTPLQTWNPYKLQHYPGKSNYKKPIIEKKVNNLNRNGDLLNKDRAYYGTSDQYYYFTPESFYDNLVGGKGDPADTVRRNAIGVLDKARNIRRVLPSGISIMTKEIPGVGVMRLRYPIMPIHDYGNVIHKEVAALADMTLKKHKYAALYPDTRSENGTIEEIFLFETSLSTKTPPDAHIHTLEVTSSEIAELKSGKFITVTTSTNAGHSHEIEITYNKKWNTLNIRRCEGVQWGMCWDGHRGKIYCPDCRSGEPVN